MPNKLKVILRKLEDVKLMLQLRDCDPASRALLLEKIGAFRSAVLKSMFWSWDHADLLSYEKSLMDEYYQAVDISDLTSITNHKK